MTGERGMQHLR